MAPSLTIGQVAKTSGVAAKTIRYYEQIGVLPAPSRALSAVQVGGLLRCVAIGFPHVGDVDLLTGPGVGGVLTAAALVFFAFIGFDEVITLAEETRDPTRTVPRVPVLPILGLASVALMMTQLDRLAIGLEAWCSV